MKFFLRQYCSKLGIDIYPHSTVKIFKNKSTKNDMRSKRGFSPPTKESNPPETNAADSRKALKFDFEYRENEVKIQMLSKNIFEQIFKESSTKNNPPEMIEKYLSELSKHGIKVGESPKLKDVILKLPKLKGENIEEHFEIIAEEQCGPYKNLIKSLLTAEISEKPQEWIFKPGWTCYFNDGSTKSVEYPEEDALVFDIEVCMSEGSAPTLCCAVGKNHWYSWMNSNLLDPHTSASHPENRKYTLEDLIPLGKKSPKLIIGHNVSYDRARIREQYLIEDTGTRFLDTMSIHVCVSGVTSYQRAMLKANKEMDEEDIGWSSQSSLNSLTEVYKLYCAKELVKEPRDVFVKGSLEDVRANFQYLMNYCAGDTSATYDVFRSLYPMFEERFPHPATLAGMLEIGSAYLPVNSNWNRYIEECNLTYEDLDIESRYHLSKKADESCELMHDDQYKKNLWMWDQDWSIQSLKMKKIPTTAKRKSKMQKHDPKEEAIRHSEMISSALEDDEETEENLLKRKFQYLYETKSLLPARRPLLPGYPTWYRKLCAKSDTENWSPGTIDIGTGMQVTPKLLSLCWEGYPLHFVKDNGWGFLIPFREEHPDNVDGKIPIEELVKKCPVMETETEASYGESCDAMNTLWKDVESNLSKKDFYKKAKKDRTSGKYIGTGIWCNIALEDCCWFLKLPHKNGPSFRVGNPLAKDFLNKFSENVLSGDGGTSAQRVIEIARMLSYWRNNRDRITKQLVVWISKENLPKHLRNSVNNVEMDYGAIIPQVVVCGTLTRRAMEPTWMTASNAQRERVGSELRAMIQAPEGYRIVGADVDSQELWIASVLGDANATGIHGATPLGWMTLSGTKSNGTDMHSITAKAVGISRDHAKVINYARIYGAGQNFAETLLKQFNPTISSSEAKSKAMKMFSLTKGKKLFYLLRDYQDAYENRGYSPYEALKIAAAHGKSVQEIFHRPLWRGGTESAMFNRLEEIAESESPVTPFLNCHLSRALEPKRLKGQNNGSRTANDDRFLPTRVNWVVQSGAVDFLHLMLVCMRWLMGNHIKFCLSFHDEVRYMVKEDLAYKTALAMHVTNLLTRSFCARKIGLNDLPQSVAFFSSVEIDRILRKESSMDCKTPSNPHGLEAGYSIPKGESLDIYKTIEKIGSNDMSKWEWHLKKTRKRKIIMKK